VELLERDAERGVLAAAIEDSPTVGRVVVVVGEAGIGKTALVAAVCDALPARRVLWGACDPLITPRPLGPLRDVARAAGGALAAAVEEGAREAVLAAALDELATGPSSSSRICTGPTTRRSTSSPCSGGASCARPAASS
jgi:predicted ATPase